MLTQELIYPLDISRQRGPVRQECAAGAEDSGALVLGVHVLNDGQPFDLTGCGAKASFLRPDGTAVTLTGEIDENLACVTLTAECLASEGFGTLQLKVTEGGLALTVLLAEITIVGAGA